MTAAVIIMRQRRIVRRFTQAGALDANSAVTPDSLGIRRSLAFRRLVAHEVVREAGRGRFYVDPQAAARLLTRRRLLALMLLFLAAVTGTVIILITKR